MRKLSLGEVWEGKCSKWRKAGLGDPSVPHWTLSSGTGSQIWAYISITWQACETVAGLASTFRVPDSEGLGWGLRISPSYQFSVDGEATDLGSTL